MSNLDSTDWDNDAPTDVDRWLEIYSQDSSLFWSCSVGHIQNVLDELIYRNKTNQRRAEVSKYYRKRPVIVEAMQYTGDNGCDIGLFVGYADRNENNQFVISTLEGTMLADVGDFIIRGVQGEFYPCKPDIFEQTYELIKGEQK